MSYAALLQAATQVAIWAGALGSPSPLCPAL